MFSTGLPDQWRERADSLERYAATGAAEAFRAAARELEEALAAYGNEALTLVAAGRESPYTADWLGRLVKQGRIPNAGRKGAPRILRRHLVAFCIGEDVPVQVPAVSPKPEPKPSPPRASARTLSAFRSRAVASRR